MKFTIIADKLPTLSVDEFKHEFCHVHAQETKQAASSLGLITRYTQGLATIDHGATQQLLTHLPLPEHPGPYQSLAQLTWPSVAVLQGSLQSAGYRASAAARHEFAAPEHVFLTEQLEPDQEDRDGLGRAENISEVTKNKQQMQPVVLIAALSPKSDLDDAAFRECWAEHAAQDVQRLRGTGTARTFYYQRNAVIPVQSQQIRAMFSGTQFPADKCWGRGGYEEFVFDSAEDAQSFCREHGEGLEVSYGRFCDVQRSWCAGFDYVEHWGRGDVGLRQRLVGSVLGIVLGMKTFLGV